MGFFSTPDLKGDIYGGVTAGVVALPLALALGVASGVADGAIAGMYGAIAVGFFAAMLGGTPSQISGPTGPMIVVVVALVESLAREGHPPELVFTAVMMAGALQIVFGALRLGQYIRLVPYPVVSGFMSGIGAIIIILQIGRLLGQEPPGGTVAALRFLPEAIANVNLNAVLIGAISLAVVYGWPQRWGKFLPSPLAALIVATIASLFIEVPVLADVPTGLPELHLPAFGLLFADGGAVLWVVLKAAIILAALGAIDSLLTSLVADNMTRTRHDSNRELFGQGIGNIVAGFLGGIAGAGATMRTVVNIRAGGNTKISGMIHSVILLVIVLGAGPIAAAIPHAALAGILVKVGVDIIDWTYLRRAHRGPRWDLLLMALVLGLTVFVNLIAAVLLGVFLAALAFVRQVAQQQLELLQGLPDRVEDPQEAELFEQARGRVTVFDLAGPLSFGAAADMGHHVRMKSKEDAGAIILDFSRVPFIDVSAARAVETVACDGKRMGKNVYVSGANEKVRATLKGLDADHCLEVDAYHPKRIDALRMAVQAIKQADGGATPQPA
ncbi:MAG: SulP family inorganic anion transporter [Pseudomonadota bacterium]